MARALLVAAGLLALLAPRHASAQTPYIIGHSVGTWAPISGGVAHPPVAYGVFPALDEGAVELPLPFPFSWYGELQTTAWAYTNGFLGFLPPNTVGILRPPRTVPSPANPMHAFIGALWLDLNGGATAAIRTEVTGAPGARVFIVQWEHFERNGTTPGVTNADLQVRLFEGTHAVEVVYGPNVGLLGATAAIESADGAEGANLMAPSATCDAACTCVPGSCASTHFTLGRTIRVELPDQPELQASLQSPPGAAPGASFDAVVTVRNAGLAPAGPFGYQVFLANSPTDASGDRLLVSGALTALAGVSAVSTTHTLTIPADVAVGAYVLKVVVDPADAVAEVNEVNNQAFSSTFRTGPDLVGTVSGPARTGPGEPFEVQVDLRSDGAPVTTPVQVQFYLSTTPAVSAGSVPLSPPQLITLPDGFSTSETLTLTTPLSTPPSPPEYYVVGRIDDVGAIPETDESNNVMASQVTLQVQRAELDATSINAGDFGFRGLSYPITTVVANTGGATARDLTVCAFLSDNLLISVISDLRLAESPLITLAPGEARTIRLDPVIPVATATGTWFVATVVDCNDVVREPVETNNTRRRLDAITIIDPSPDLVPADIATASTAAAGETAPVAIRVANIGNAAGAAPVRLVISTNPGVTAQDTLLYETPGVLSLEAGAEATVSEWVAIPGGLVTGNYYLGAVVDPQDSLQEIRDDNNTLVLGPLVVVGADLAITSPTPPNPVIGDAYAWRFAAAGGAEAYRWTLTWDSGVAPAGLSFDPARAELTGTAGSAAEGSHPFTVRVDSGSLSAQVHYDLLVTPPSLALTVVSGRLPPAVARNPYAVSLVAAGGFAPYTWSLGSAAPVGLALAPDGLLGGEPRSAGNFSFTVVARDQSGQRAEGLVRLDVVDPSSSISITTAGLPSGVVKRPYEMALNATGGLAPYTWSVLGPLPPGIAFEPAAARLVGTPTVAGDYEVLVEVRDAEGLFDRNGYALEILPEGVLRVVTGNEASDRLPDGEVGEPYLDADGEQARLRANPPEGTTWYLVSGILPPGLTLEPASGVISGTPTADGTFAFTVLVTNRANDARRATLAIVVAPARGQVRIPDDGCTCRGTEGRPRDGLLAPFAALALWMATRRRRA